MPFVLILADFWVEKAEGAERVFVSMQNPCPEKGCGGRIHCVVHVGTIEQDRFLVRNASAMENDAQFPLPKKIQCSNCSLEMSISDELKVKLSASTEQFMRDLKGERIQVKARWN